MIEEENLSRERTWSSSGEAEQKEESKGAKKEENFLKAFLRKIRRIFRDKLETERRLEELRRKYEGEGSSSEEEKE